LSVSGIGEIAIILITGVSDIKAMEICPILPNDCRCAD
jgi:hypothetical protein